MKLELNAVTGLLTSTRGEVQNMRNGVGSMMTKLFTLLKSNMFNEKAKEMQVRSPIPLSHMKNSLRPLPHTKESLIALPNMKESPIAIWNADESFISLQNS